MYRQEPHGQGRKWHGAENSFKSYNSCMKAIKTKTKTVIY
jgi:hypothetical protein